jgi:Na+/glutamate symporter
MNAKSIAMGVAVVGSLVGLVYGGLFITAKITIRRMSLPTLLSITNSYMQKLTDQNISDKERQIYTNALSIYLKELKRRGYEYQYA